MWSSRRRGRPYPYRIEGRHSNPRRSSDAHLSQTSGGVRSPRVHARLVPDRRRGPGVAVVSRAGRARRRRRAEPAGRLGRQDGTRSALQGGRSRRRPLEPDRVGRPHLPDDRRPGRVAGARARRQGRHRPRGRQAAHLVAPAVPRRARRQAAVGARGVRRRAAGGPSREVEPGQPHARDGRQDRGGALRLGHARRVRLRTARSAGARTSARSTRACSATRSPSGATRARR